MGKFKRKNEGDSPKISTASLPDIVFMLLFFFMVATVLREVELKVTNELPKATEVSKLQKAAENSLNFTIDLENQKISYFDKNINHEVSFELDKAKKTSLLEGLDDIGLTLAKVNHISDFENKQKSRTPWLYSQQIK